MFKLYKGTKTYYQKNGLKGVKYYLTLKLYNQFIKSQRFANWHYFLNPERVISKRYENEIQLIDNSFKKYGNYYLSEITDINSSSIIYSLGVLSDTDFDQAISDKFKCSVYLFDPSIIATRHINKKNNPKFIFTEVAISNSTGEVEFSTPTYGGSPSMFLNHRGQKFNAKTITIKEAMDFNNHSKIDILKLDIEGAAPIVINNMLDNKIYPSQIIAEFERPNKNKASDFIGFYFQITKLINRLECLGYSTYRLPREKYRYYSLELIFVRKH